MFNIRVSVGTNLQAEVEERAAAVWILSPATVRCQVAWSRTWCRCEAQHRHGGTYTQKGIALKKYSFLIFHLMTRHVEINQQILTPTRLFMQMNTNMKIGQDNVRQPVVSASGSTSPAAYD
ncbi:hypothetical protein F2P81_024901 [Scophthalmus maximus]|uniref:Uncharacterized protein n=1 Tax=Scophthalmus maximus TaxID=52904 RepID=A0A6A4RU68_SCOMX|nr:hypothetical protein F2P81_024901 [Scophthalmus maximus]